MVKHLNYKEPTMLKKTSVQVLLVIVAALLFVNIIISCSGDSSKKPGDTKTQMKPSEVVKAAYMAANEAKYSEADKFLSSEIMNAVKELSDGLKDELLAGLKEAWDAKTNNRTIKEIEIVKEDEQGKEAKITIKIHFKDGKTDDVVETLIKEGGQWKMTLE